jgi:dUTP pyrophosphatase
MDDRQPPVIGVKACDDLLMPFYATQLAAGADIKAAIEQPLTLEPFQRVLVPTGLFLDIPSGYEVQVRSRSGLAAKFGVVVLNSPGTIDADYKGEIKVILMNHSDQPFVIEPQMRIAQLVCAKVEQAQFVCVDTLSLSERGTGGFGSSGLL